MMIVYFFKPTYSVSLNGEFIGYTQNKSELQAKINDAIQKGDGANLAFIQIDSMPEYKLCLLKKDVQTNDDEIYNKIVGQGTTYYRYYAILEDGEEKYYVSKFEDAEDIVKQLKDKESTNSDKITILEKYNTPALPGILGAWSVIARCVTPCPAAYTAISSIVLYACPLAIVCVCVSNVNLILILVSTPNAMQLPGLSLLQVVPV